MKKIKLYSTLLFLIAIPIILLILPSDFFNGKKSTCLSIILFDIKCYGCGLTRATMNLIHFNFQKAWEFNSLTFITTPIIATVWMYYLVQTWKKT